jgi:signal transduction histidine kinase
MKLWPRTLFTRLTLIFFAGLIVANALSYVLIMGERTSATTGLMLDYLERDVASSVALLDRLPKEERAAWLPRLERRTYSFILGPGDPGGQPDTEKSRLIAASFEDAIGKRYKVTAVAVPGGPNRTQAQLILSDGTPLTIDMWPAGLPVPMWLPVVLVAQVLLIVLLVWLGARWVTRPLTQLAQAADALGPDLRINKLAEDGPSEVAHAARAFNAMQERIGHYTAERMQILAAISHDLQTPITRMRMRADMLDDEQLRGKFTQDLKEMEALVREGVSYARTLHGASEPPSRVDPDALLDSLVCDYQDGGKNVTLQGQLGQALMTRPQTLRRVLGNLIDNALKYAGPVQVQAELAGATATIRILDRGSGIPEEQLEMVFQPFYRVEGSRNRETGGTGLGLAIARQLSLAMNASLSLHNRAEGGLEARLIFTDLPEAAE